MNPETFLLLLVFAAGFYMAWNIGANDVANAVGTSVGSGALSIGSAVLLAAILEFCGAYFFGSHVANTMQQGIVNPQVFSLTPKIYVLGMLSSLIASGIWLQFASFSGLPVSTTHTIVGAIVGFGIIAGGVNSIYWGAVTFIALSWVISPLVSGTLGFLIFTLLRKKIFYAPCPVKAAKKITPILVFIFVMTLSTVLLYKGIAGVASSITFLQAILASIGCGLFVALFFFFIERMVPTPQGETTLTKPQYSLAAAESIDKALSHLRKASKESIGKIANQANYAIEEIEQLSSMMKQKEYLGSSDYASVEKIFGYLQILSACFMAFAHGANDVANAIGPLSAAVAVLFSGSIPSGEIPVPSWILALGGVGIVAGLATWGWRVIETIGKKITELTPSRGFSAEFGSALTIIICSRLGLPVSTTHILVGGVLGVGLARGLEALDLTTTRDIAIAWFVTVPAGAILSIATFYFLTFTLGAMI